MLKLTLELLPHGDEEKAEVIGEARICNLMEHEPGSPLGSFHGWFRLDGQDRELNAFVKDWPRQERTEWELVSALLAQVTAEVFA
jgi:hypothetical protein